MSGGFFEYEDYKLDEWSGYIKERLEEENEWRNYTREEKELMKKTSWLLLKMRFLLHSFDYAISGDTSMKEYEKDFNKIIKEIKDRL